MQKVYRRKKNPRLPFFSLKQSGRQLFVRAQSGCLRLSLQVPYAAMEQQAGTDQALWNQLSVKGISYRKSP